jgi:hypothetical protein
MIERQLLWWWKKRRSDWWKPFYASVAGAKERVLRN